MALTLHVISQIVDGFRPALGAGASGDDLGEDFSAVIYENRALRVSAPSPATIPHALQLANARDCFAQNSVERRSMRFTPGE